MNNDIEVVKPDLTEYVSMDDFKLYVKGHGAKLKVVDDHYRWIYENTDGELVMVIPKK